MHRKARGTAQADQPAMIALHLSIVFQPVHHLFEDALGVRFIWRCEAVMHPLSFATRTYQTRPAQVSQVTANFGLTSPHHFNKEANADLILADQTQQAQASAVRERQEEPLHIELPGLHADIIH
ncbi:MAG: hypothetical protein QOD75_3060 [Blastocatellia bacterium]|nr:hypothetical protein [Blastocatellia bacterium]